MRSILPAIAVAFALSFASASSFAYGLCDLIGCPKDGCGCACEADCCCEPSCAGECGCEVGCGCEPACGCGSGCCCDGRQFAGQTYNCGCKSNVPWCPCTGSKCCNTGCCDTGCCDPCGCEVSCGCEPACGCGSGCGDCCEPCCPPKSHRCCLKDVGFCGPYYCVAKLFSCCGSSCGCGEEVYWSEWHNDPPRCCDPCDCYGNWTGPSAGSHRAPYAHAYSPNSYGGETYVTKASATSTFVKSRPAQQHTVARHSQPTHGKTQTANNRGAAAIVIRR